MVKYILLILLFLVVACKTPDRSALPEDWPQMPTLRLFGVICEEDVCVACVEYREVEGKFEIWEYHPIAMCDTNVGLQPESLAEFRRFLVNADIYHRNVYQELVECRRQK